VKSKDLKRKIFLDSLITAKAYTQNDKKKSLFSFSLFKKGENRAFTLIELLVVVLIIAILASIAIPQYMAVRDKARLAGLMEIGKNVLDAMDRRSLFDDTYVSTALNLLDISLKDAEGTDCYNSNLDGDGNSGTCRITVSGKDYQLRPYLNYLHKQGSNIVAFSSYTDTSMGRLNIYNNISAGYNGENTYMLRCYDFGGTGIFVDVPRCVKIGKSLGAINSECDKDNETAFCRFN